MNTAIETNQRPGYRTYRPGYSPAIVRRHRGENLLASIEAHRRRTGWQGPVVVVPA